jgi:hypothetical protein
LHAHDAMQILNEVEKKKYVDIFTIMALMHFYYLCGYIFLKGHAMSLP